MTVAELKNLLNDFDENLEVYLVDLTDDTESGTHTLGNVSQEELTSHYSDEETVQGVVITF